MLLRWRSMRRSWFLIAALVLALAVPSSAMALAGGSTGSGGGGGGGGGGSSSSSSHSFSSSSGSSSTSSTGSTGSGGWVAGLIVLVMMGAFFAGAVGLFVLLMR